MIVQHQICHFFFAVSSFYIRFHLRRQSNQMNQMNQTDENKMLTSDSASSTSSSASLHAHALYFVRPVTLQSSPVLDQSNWKWKWKSKAGMLLNLPPSPISHLPSTIYYSTPPPSYLVLLIVSFCSHTHSAKLPKLAIRLPLI